MNRLFKWLGNRLLPQEAVVEQAPVRRRIEVGNPPGASPAEKKRRGQPDAPPMAAVNSGLVEFDTDMIGHIETIGPGKNVLVRNHGLRDQAGNDDGLEIVDDVGLDDGESAGFDPYNTGRFDRGEKWRSRVWK